MKGLKLALTAAAFVVIIGASIWGYNSLSRRYEDQQDTAGNRTEEENDNDLEPPQEPKETVAYYDFTGVDAEGNEISLSDYVGGGLTVVNFWASWCGPCESEMEDFIEAQDRYIDSGVTFLMVNLTDGARETQETALRFLSDRGLAFDNLLFDIDYDGAYTYGISSIPVTMFIDAQGEIFSGYIGAINLDILQEVIEGHISGGS